MLYPDLSKVMFMYISVLYIVKKIKINNRNSKFEKFDKYQIALCDTQDINE